MTEKKTRSPKKMTVDAIKKQFDLQSLEDKLILLVHAEVSIGQDKEKLEAQLKLIGNKA